MHPNSIRVFFCKCRSERGFSVFEKQNLHFDEFLKMALYTCVRSCVKSKLIVAKKG